MNIKTKYGLPFAETEKYIDSFKLGLKEISQLKIQVGDYAHCRLDESQRSRRVNPERLGPVLFFAGGLFR